MGLASSFLNGASYLISRSNFIRYVWMNNTIGRWNEALSRGELFVVPSEDLDRLIETFPDQPRVWEDALGLPEGALGDHPLRINIDHPEEYGLRLPDGMEMGANDEFIPGGKLPQLEDYPEFEPLNEGVTDLVDNPAYNLDVGSVTEVTDYVDEIDVELEEYRESLGAGEEDVETVEVETTVTQETEIETEVEDTVEEDGTVTQTATTTVNTTTTEETEITVTNDNDMEL